jgi:RHS repeat-associated protein
LDTVTFPAVAGQGGGYAQHGALNASVHHIYAFDASATFSGPVSIQASDRAGNTATSNVVLIHDTIAPTLQLDASSEGLTLSMSWSASDAEAGLNRCLLDLVNGAVVQTIANQCSGSLSYPGVQDVNYTLRFTAWDNVHNQAVQEVGTTVASVTKYYYHGTTRIAMRKGNVVYYLHGDHLGSTSLTTDGGGKVVHEARYLPYGQVRWEQGGGVTDFGFTDQRNKADFGFMDFNARYYAPGLGMFISPDTIAPDPTHGYDYNRYLFVRGNPLKYNDPSGHDGCLVTESGSWDCPQQSDTQTINIDSGLTADPATLTGETEYGPIRTTVSKVIDTVLPDSGAASIGIAGSAGMGVDVVGNVGLVYGDGQGNIQILGASIGFGGNTGANIDGSVFVNVMPGASNVDVYSGQTVNTGISAGEGVGGAFEVNVTRDPVTNEPTAGFTLSAGVSAKVNVPAPPVELYGNVTHTWLSPFQFNIYEALDLPKPEEQEKKYTHERKEVTFSKV